jgi:hypothetical protein
MLALAVISSILLVIQFVAQFLRIVFNDSKHHTDGVILLACVFATATQAFLQTTLWILYST